MRFPSMIFRPMRFGLRLAGVWPGSEFRDLYKFVWLIVIPVFQTYQFSYIITHFKSDTLMNITENFSISIPLFLFGIKLITTWTNYGVFCDILYTMEEDCKKYTAIDTNNLMSKTRQISFYLTTFILSSYVMSLVLYIIGTMVFERDNNSTRELVLKMDLPFEITDTPNYVLVITIQILIYGLGSFTFATFSAFFTMVVLHVGCQIDIMCQNLIDVPCNGKLQLLFFINRYQEVTVFVERIEKLYTYVALSQLVLNTLITCSFGFLIVIAVNAGNGLPVMIKSILFYFAFCFESFLFCFAGEYLNTKSKLIGDTVYDILWYDLHPNDSLLLIPVILKSQKGFTLTFGKFSTLSLESFTNVMKVSVSYMSVLLAMY